MMRGGSWILLLMVACGPGLPPASTETDASGGPSTGGPTPTTSGHTGDTSGTTVDPTTSAPTSTGTGPSTTTTATTTTTTTGDETTTGSTGTTDPAETTDSTGGPLASCCFVPAVGNADVSGATPLGPIALTWAWYGIHGGECGGLEIDIYDDPAQIGTQVGPLLQIWLKNLPMPGKQPAWFSVIDPQSVLADVEGEIDVVAIDEGHRPWWCEPGDPVVETDARAKLSFTLVADGWDLTGTVDAVYCPALNVICP